jgi:heme/copper-type cytochrome/quinol oxidase subunit 3
LTDIAHPLAAPNPHLETSTGLDSRKLAIWTFLGSECMFFASLISTYVVYRGKSLVGPFPHTPWTDPATGQVYEPIIEIPLVTVGTALLLFSSLFIVLALYGAQKGNRKMLLGWLGATIMCGVFFVGMQVYEFTHFVHKGLTLQRNMFGASFFTLTGFHGTHVTIGVIWLLTMFVLALRKQLPPENAINLEMAALYWHFVDVVWIIIFPVVYLMQ